MLETFNARFWLVVGVMEAISLVVMLFIAGLSGFYIWFVVQAVILGSFGLVWAISKLLDWVFDGK
jgi:hypothetical protein